jgi:hypothetical protein
MGQRSIQAQGCTSNYHACGKAKHFTSAQRICVAISCDALDSKLLEPPKKKEPSLHQQPQARNRLRNITIKINQSISSLLSQTDRNIKRP